MQRKEEERLAQLKAEKAEAKVFENPGADYMRKPWAWVIWETLVNVR